MFQKKALQVSSILAHSARGRDASSRCRGATERRNILGRWSKTPLAIARACLFACDDERMLKFASIHTSAAMITTMHATFFTTRCAPFAQHLFDISYSLQFPYNKIISNDEAYTTSSHELQEQHLIFTFCISKDNPALLGFKTNDAVFEIVIADACFFSAHGERNEVFRNIERKREGGFICVLP